ncbi:MAG: acyl-CoA dehydrogenase family protein [Novosphingobium sp.]|nr:acyl-CoA dehydrogenase family protein [Novosphingobium sp.]
MTSMPAATTSAGTPISWLERVRALGPMIDAAAAANEDATELAPEVVSALDDAGVFALLAPREVGGAEAHPLDAIDVISELSYWDGSAGWYGHAVITGGAVAGAYLGSRAVAAIFPNGRFLHAAGQAAPTGKAVREGDCYRISGRYSFGSGTPRARFIVGGYIVHEGDAPIRDENGQPIMLIGLAPRETVRFLGNWNVLGLRGTGSVDFEVTEQLLHEDFFINATAPLQRRGGALYRMGFMAIPCLSHASFALGTARRLLDEWRQFARAKSRGSVKASDLATFQRDYAAALADLHAVDAYVRTSFANLFNAAQAGTVTAELQLETQLCTSQAFIVAKRIVQAAIDGCTTQAIRNGNPIQRCIRDIIAGSAHILNSEQALIDAGKVLAGAGDSATPMTRGGYALNDGRR